MKRILQIFLLAITFLINHELKSQASACPSVNAGSDQTVCPGQCVNLTATIQGTLQTNTYNVSTIAYSPYSYTTGTPVLVNIDDVWTPVINMPFCFQFFGNTYTQMVIGSNGLISFDLTYANAYCQWPIGAAIPSASDPLNSIMAPWHDIDPSIGSTSDTRYAIYGTAPCRQFVVSWYNIPMFSGSCNSMLASQQIVLHESTNIIDIYISNKPLCSSWNGGYAIEGIQNATGTAAFFVAGRNYPSTWTATNDGKRFMPAGAPNYTLTWTGPLGPLGSANPINVCPATTSTYTATVTNTTCAGNIVVTDQVTVFTTGGGITTTGSQTNVTCNGQCTGSATVTVTSGSGPFTYAWAPSGGSAATASGLCAGTYTCTVTNTVGCMTTQTFNITQPPVITLVPSQTNVLCNGQCTGVASVVASGGTGVYTYSWAPSGGSGASATGLCVGTYTCTVTSGPVGCTATQTFNITQPTAITSTMTSTPAMCSVSNGTASISVSGGTLGYSYNWTPGNPTGDGTANVTGLSAGSWTCTVTDANGCTHTNTVNVTSTSGLTATASGTPVLCNGGSTGTATAAPVGGTGPFTYAWSPSGGSSATAAGLAAGTYTCIVTDVATGCTATATVTITQPSALSTTGTQTNILCNGSCTGAASVTVTGGTGGYTYLWAPAGGTGASATGLCAGTYTVTATDANGCTIAPTFNITQPTAIALVMSSTTATCGMPNGSASVVASGGAGSYTYSWSPSGGTGSSATNLLAGFYSVLVTDANGCTATGTVNVANAGSPTATITATTNVSCFGGNNGSSTVTASGGTTPYTYAWTPTGGTGSTGTALIAGSYTVTVTDFNGCSTTATVAITQPPAVTATASGTPVLCNGGATGTATVTPGGGVGSYTYNWAPSGGTGATASSLIAGNYTCTVTDGNGCTAQATVAITQPTAVTATVAGSPVLCNGGATGSATVTPGGGVGSYTYNWAPTGGTGASASALSATNYTVTVTDGNGCTVTATIAITQPTALSATTSFTQSTCGAANGSASVVAGGGAGGYTYNWLPSGGTGATATGLLSGNYSCTITDANNCTLTATVNVPSANSPTVSILDSTNVSCFGGNDGSATATSIGGTTPYSYLWSNADADSVAGNLAIGTYTVTVTDANGCTSTTTVTITEPPQLTSVVSGTDILCFGGTTGSAFVTASGGTGAYTYLWSPSGGSADTATSLGAGTYSCVITDANGCTNTATITLTEPPLLTVASAGFNVSCFGVCDGQLVAIPAGGNPNYTFVWSTGCTTPSCNNICAGQYTVTVTDMNGCTTSDTALVTEPTAIAIVTSSVDAHCNQADGSASAAGSGGTGTLNYQWISGPATANYNNIAASTYSVIVTDANGCADTATAVVNNLNGVNATLTSSTNLTCFQSADGAIDIDATGGILNYTYTWTPSVSSTDVATGLSAGTYTVVVTDSSGCTATVTTTITEPALVTVAATSTPTAVCVGDPVTLNAVPAGGTPGYTTTWNPGALVGNSQTLVPPATTTYTVDVTDQNGCTASTTVLVTVNDLPVAVLGSDLTSGCAPLCVNFDDLSTITANSTITGWSWDFGDQSTSTQQNPNHCYATPGNYTVVLTVTTSAGCSQTITMNNYIQVFALPVASFVAGPQPTTILNPTVTFTDSSLNAASWNWNFGDLNNSASTDQNPSFTYPDPDCYLVTLEVTSADGCMDSTEQIICIDPDVIIFVPNTFTPDDNGTNDVFIPVTVGIDPDKYELWVFDRWGNMIFYTDDLNDGWDGKVLGSDKLCQVDTYVWKIMCKDILDKRHELIGHVNLIR